MTKLIVIKRNGDKVKFFKCKISNAISKANNEMILENKISKRKINEISNHIRDELIEKRTEEISVEEIQDVVERHLYDEANYELAKAYIIYRYVRSEIRERNRDLALKVKNRASGKICLNSNTNVDEASFSGREKEASADVSKSVALDYKGLSERTSHNHKIMLVYQHDLEKAIYGIHNCLNLNVQKLFKGFRTRNTDVRIPASFSTACQLIAVGFQCQSQVCSSASLVGDN